MIGKRKTLDEKSEKLRFKKLAKKQKLQEQGITLIALVVTIIILLILAGVTLNIALSDNGLFSKTKKATEDYKEAQEDEKEKIENISEYLNAIPIYDSNQLLMAGSGQEVTINGENYIFNGERAYMLQNDIECTSSYDEIAKKVENGDIKILGNGHKITVVMDGKTKYYTENSKFYIATNKQGYVLKGLEAYYDGIENTKSGHDTNSNVWEDLSGNSVDGAMKGFDVSNCWTNDGLIFDGVDDYVGPIDIEYKDIGVEAVICKDSGGDFNEKIFSTCDGWGFDLFVGDNRLAYFEWCPQRDVYEMINVDFETAGIKDVFSTNISISGMMKMNDSVKLRVNDTFETGECTEIEWGWNGMKGMIGKHYGEGEQYMTARFKGEIKCLRLYSEVLSETEMLVNYKADKIRFGDK